MSTSGNGETGNVERRLNALETRFDTILPTLATKADIGDLKGDIGDLKGDIGDLKADMGSLNAAIGVVAGDAKSSVAEAKAAIITWLTASLLAVVAIFLSSLFFVANRLAQPTIIYSAPASMAPAVPQAPLNSPAAPAIR